MSYILASLLFWVISSAIILLAVIGAVAVLEALFEWLRRWWQ